MALKSKALPVLIVVALCLLGIRSLVFVGTSTRSEDSAGKPLVSATAIMKFVAFWTGLQFLSCYVFTAQSMKGYWPDGFETEKEQKIAHYLMRCVGHNQLPMLLLSVIMLVTDTVSKEFMLMLALHWSFCFFDITRMTTTCEAIGVKKQTLYPYIPICMIVSSLAYATLSFMDSSTTMEGSESKPFVSSTAIVKFVAFFAGFQFLTCYVFTTQSMKGYWPDGFKTEREQKIAHYLMMCVGQNQLPMLLLSVIMLMTDTVSKEFMLMLALHWGFGVFEITRMTTTCEAIGVKKQTLYPYIPMCIIVSSLACAAWKTM